MTSFLPAWIIYWYIGYLLKDRDIFKDISRNTFLAGAIFFLILTIAEGYWIDICNINISPVSQMKISNMLYCLCAVGFIFKSEKRTKKSLITVVGDYSYGIYFIHFIFIYIILDYLEYISRIPLPVLLIAGAAAVLGISMTVIFIVKRIFGKKSAGVFFGF